MLKKALLASAFAVGLMTISGGAQAQSVEQAKEFIAQFASRQDTWTGPTTGPKAQDGKVVVMLASDLTNGGVLGAADGANTNGFAV